MSEPTPLWTGDQVMAYAMTITNDPGKRALARRVALELVHQYEAERAKDKQRIQELEAELARLREPVPVEAIGALLLEAQIGVDAQWSWGDIQSAIDTVRTWLQQQGGQNDDE